jgi:hypothetical protein
MFFPAALMNLQRTEESYDLIQHFQTSPIYGVVMNSPPAHLLLLLTRGPSSAPSLSEAADTQAN